MAASSSCVKWHMWRSCVEEKALLFHYPYFTPPTNKKFSRGSCKVVNFHSRRTSSFGLSYLKASPYCIRETSLRLSCLGSLVDLDGVTASDFVAISDQLLLMTTVVLTYMAGVIPVKKSHITSSEKFLDDNLDRESAASSGSAKKNDHHVKSKYAWDAVKEKLLDSFDTIKNKNKLGNKLLEVEQQQAKRPLSLSAVSDGPNLRLLWASFKQLEDEVNSVLGNCEALDLDDWLTIFPDIIQKSCDRLCMSWLLEELHLENKKPDEGIVALMIQKFKGHETVLQNIRKSGKEDLYAELLYFLRFGSFRKSSCFDQSLFSSHGESILEDLVITLADGIASAYLELISVDGNLSNEMNDLGIVMCNLSTRELQRLRNEVSLNQWLYQNVEAIISMYEDRFDLRTLKSKVITEPSQTETEENSSWWKKLTQRQSRRLSLSLSYVVISQFSMPVKRTKELRALTGWRYYFSLYLELSDIGMPLVRGVISKVSSGISFFLVSLIGRSLGLIYTGIRQSLRWK